MNTIRIEILGSTNSGKSTIGSLIVKILESHGIICDYDDFGDSPMADSDVLKRISDMTTRSGTPLRVSTCNMFRNNIKVG